MLVEADPYRPLIAVRLQKHVPAQRMRSIFDQKTSKECAHLSWPCAFGDAFVGEEARAGKTGEVL